MWSTLNSGEIRKLSWAKHIKSYEEVPDIYKFFFAPLQAEGQVFPYTILTPTFEGLLQARTTEKLVCDLDHEIYVLEKAGDVVKVYGYPIEEISCVEVRIVLLDSQIKIYGITKDGLPTSIAIKFNTATEELFTPILEKIRRVAIGSDDRDSGSEIKNLDYLEKLDYKFMNYARHSLLEGEKIIQMLLQPKIQVRLLTVFGKTFHKVISKAHLSILTDQELIVIREEDNPRVIGEYGKVRTYIRSKKIVDLCLDSKSGEYPKLSIQLPGDVRIENLYDASAEPEVCRLISQFADVAKQY
jgi:hypothetical protein